MWPGIEGPRARWNLTTLGWDKTLRSLWQRGEYTDICSKEELWAGVAETAFQEEVKGEENKQILMSNARAW